MVSTRMQYDSRTPGNIVLLTCVHNVNGVQAFDIELLLKLLVHFPGVGGSQSLRVLVFLIGGAAVARDTRGDFRGGSSTRFGG